MWYMVMLQLISACMLLVTAIVDLTSTNVQACINYVSGLLQMNMMLLL